MVGHGEQLGFYLIRDLFSNYINFNAFAKHLQTLKESCALYLKL